MMDISPVQNVRGFSDYSHYVITEIEISKDEGGHKVVTAAVNTNRWNAAIQKRTIIRDVAYSTAKAKAALLRRANINAKMVDLCAQ